MAEERTPTSPCPCGSGEPFGRCHGLDATSDAATRVAANSLTHGYWLVAFVDLLGQKNAFLKTDYLPDVEDPQKVEAFLDAVRASTGVCRMLASSRLPRLAAVVMNPARSECPHGATLSIPEKAAPRPTAYASRDGAI